MQATPGMQINVEYFFRLFYDCVHGTCYGSMAGVSAFFAHLWLWVTGIGYTFSALGLFIIVYLTVRIFELRAREKEFYNTPLPSPDALGGINPRWQHIESLANGANASEWREAIIEADIMLDDVLAQRGYVGEGVGEKLKSVEPSEVASLQDAWEAHKVRNQIAHEGSAFALSDTIARRTVAHYEKVFREFDAL